MSPRNPRHVPTGLCRKNAKTPSVQALAVWGMLTSQNIIGVCGHINDPAPPWTPQTTAVYTLWLPGPTPYYITYTYDTICGHGILPTNIFFKMRLAAAKASPHQLNAHPQCTMQRPKLAHRDPTVVRMLKRSSGGLHASIWPHVGRLHASIWTHVGRLHASIWTHVGQQREMCSFQLLP